MPSIIQGYEYDIFISYRHNDNRSGWVTEFVKSLQEELAATIKDPVSVYFDVNPHDGLLETHHVDKSLEGKLKCLIFIPILSQTYCDPKSFAWQQEFIAFNQLSRADRLGREVRLGNGNVASRILPIKIHDLDEEDKLILERETGNVLRAIEFIFKSPGVNRPLNAREDHPTDNLNKLFYRDQINKVANAIKELIAGIKKLEKPESVPPADLDQIRKKNQQGTTVTKYFSGKRIVLASAGLMILFALIYAVSQFTGSIRVEPSASAKSIAVLPFADMSSTKDQEYFSDGLSDELITLLAKVPDLKVIGRTSSFYFKGKNVDLRTIGEKLNVANLLEGSVQRAGKRVRIIAQLINAADGSHLWSETYDREVDDLFKVQDEIAEAVTEALKVTLLNKVLPPRPRLVNPEAYNLFLRGKFFYERTPVKGPDNDAAMKWFKESISADSLFALSWAYYAMSNLRLTSNTRQIEFQEARRATERAWALDSTSGIVAANMAEIFDNEYDLAASEQKIKVALRLAPNDPYVLRNAGRIYTLLGKEKESVEYCRRALQIDPIQFTAMTYLAQALISADRLDEASRFITQAREQGHQNLDDQEIRILFLRGKYDDVLRENDKLQNERGRLFWTAAVQLKSGHRTEAEKVMAQMLERCNGSCAFQIALIYGLNDDPARACDWIEKAYQNKERGIVSLKASRAFRKMASEPRFIKLLSRINFPK